MQGYLIVGLAFFLWEGLTSHTGYSSRHIVTYQDVMDYSPVVAEVDTMHHAFARARMDGMIIELNVQEGAQVNQGDVIAHIQDSQHALTLQSLAARLKSLEHEQTYTASEIRRHTPLVSVGAVSAMKLDELKTRLLTLSQQVKALQAERDRALEQIAQGSVLAPKEGRILTLPAPKGTFVRAGETIAELTTHETLLKIRVAQRHTPYLHVHQTLPLVMRSPQGHDIPHTGIIQKIYPALEKGRVVMDVAVKDVEHLLIGERIKAYVPLKKRPALYIPANLILRKHGLKYVKLSSGTETVIETGLEDAQGVEVLSGLHEGDVLLSP